MGKEVQKMNTKKHLNTRNMVLIAMFGAVAAVLMTFEVGFPLVPGFIKLDFSDFPIVLGTFVMGPIEGILIATVKILLKLLIKGTSTAYVGDFANWLYSVCYILPAALVYHFKRTKSGAVLALAAGTVFTGIVAVIANYTFIFPMYSKLFGAPMEAIIAAGTAINGKITDLGTMMIYSILPFNLFKYGLSSVITFFVYKRVKKFVLNVFSENSAKGITAETQKDMI